MNHKSGNNPGQTHHVHPRIRMLKSKEHGIGLPTYVAVKRDYENDPKRQVNEFFDRFTITAGTGRPRKASFATVRAYRARMITLIDTLAKLNMSVHNLDEITARQMKHVFEEFEAQGLSAGWIANMNTTFRRFGIWIGKDNLCPAVSNLLTDPETYKRKQSATKPRDWETLKVEFDDICEKVARKNAVTAIQMKLAMLFGARVQEFLMFRPETVIRDGKEQIYLTEGTKGGRPRFVPVETQEQKQLLQKAREIANPTTGVLQSVPGYTLRQAINNYYNTLRAVGVSIKDLGVTTHGLRHGYACRVYNTITGEKAPVLGGMKVEEQLDKAARKEVAERLGHSRLDITSNYLGNFRTMTRLHTKNLQTISETLEGNSELSDLAKETGIKEFYLLDQASKGQWTPKDKTPLVIGYRAKRNPGESQTNADMRQIEQAIAVSQAIKAILGVVVTVLPMSLYSGNETFELDLAGGTEINATVKPEIA